MSCSKSDHQREASEIILFVTVGQVPFQDAVFTINQDGSNVKRILAPERGKSYTYASGNSLRKELVVTVHELDATGQVSDHLYLYRPQTGGWRRLIDKSGMEGAGYMAPDDSRVAFVFAPDLHTPQLRPWVTNLQTTETFKLTSDDSEVGAWDGYLSWRPDGQEITFLRLRRASSGGLTSTLMRVSSSGGVPSEELASEEGVFAACYAPDGKHLAMLTKTGLEILDTPNSHRQTILTWDKFPAPQFRTGGLIWSSETNRIALAILNKEAKRYELWTISAEGRDPRRIYDQDAGKGKLTVTSFLRG